MSPDGLCVWCRKPLGERAHWYATYCSRLCSDDAAAERRKPAIGFEAIVIATAEICGVAAEDIRSPAQRSREVTDARHVAMAVMRRCGYSNAAIARLFGRDRSTVIHSLRVADEGWAERVAEAVGVSRQERAA